MTRNLVINVNASGSDISLCPVSQKLDPAMWSPSSEKGTYMYMPPGDHFWLLSKNLHWQFEWISCL